MARVTAKSLYTKLRDSNVLADNTAYARWTVAQLMADPETGFGRHKVVERDYQSIGALLVNSLASKLAQLLFPIQNPFFTLSVSDELKSENRKAGKSQAKLDGIIAEAVRSACSSLFKNSSYASIIMALKHLVVTGNVLLCVDEEANKIVAYGLQQFVTRRAGNGDAILVVHRERTYVEALDYEDQQILKGTDRQRYSRPEQEVMLYTRIQREALPGRKYRWVVTRECDEFMLPGREVYPDHECPWVPVAINVISGSHYGFGLVSEYAGDFARLSDVSEAAVLYGIEISRIINLVSTGAGADIDDLNNAQTGEYIQGDKDSVNPVEGGDYNKLRVLLEMENGTMQRLSRAFMYNGPARDAERVTMYELQLQAQEANNQLGGLFSTLAESVQIPLAVLKLRQVAPNLMPGVATGMLVPDITAGVNALGRSEEVQSLLLATQEINAIAGVLFQVDQRINPEAVLDMIYSSRSVQVEKLKYDEATQAQIKESKTQQAQATSELAQAAAANDTLQSIQETM